jgi:predicted DNA-binding transcriptional regulator YafY
MRRVLDPLGLVLKAGVWYLVARREGELRTYRLSRIEDVAAGGERFTRPDDFDLSRFWQESVAHYESSVPMIDVVVRVTDTGYRRLQWLAEQGSRVLGAREPEEHGVRDERDEHGARDEREAWTRCTVAFESLDDAYDDLTLLGADVEVFEPESLRARVAETAATVASLYAATAGT